MYQGTRQRRPIRSWTCRNAGRSLPILAVLNVVFFPGSAHAQTAVAEALFNDGRALMEAGDLAQACPKLAESHRLDPAFGTLLNLGLCYRKAGKTASAWVAYKDATALARRDNRPERVAYAENMVAEIEPTLSYLTVRVHADSRIEGLIVHVNGLELAAGAWGTAIPTDPGKLSVRATATGRKTWESEVSLGPNGDRYTVVVPLLDLLPVENSDNVGMEKKMVESGDSNPLGSDVGMESSDSRRTVGYALGGTGLVALGLGSYFGIKALSRWSDRNEHCTDAGCDDEAVTYGADANRYGNVANIGIGLGLVGVGVGTYLLLTSPTKQQGQAGVRVEPVIARESACVSVGGAW